MRKLLMGITLVTLLAGGGPARAADGIVEMSWNACAPIVQDVTSNIPGQYSIYVSVLGIDVPHKAYEAYFIYGNATETVPDAWTFDPAGCQGSSFATIDHLAPPIAAKTCPTFQGSSQSIQIKDINYVPPYLAGTYPLTNMRVSLAVAYPDGAPTPNPSTRYFLERVTFDHTYSVTGPSNPTVSCGGFEESMCFRLIQADYLDLDGAQIDFGRNGGPTAHPFVTFNGGGGCTGPTPAHATTWGSLKHQYR